MNLVAADWGTSSLRIARLDGEGRAIADDGELNEGGLHAIAKELKQSALDFKSACAGTIRA